MKKLQIITLVVIALLIISSDAAAQCGMCKAVAEESEGQGLNKGIIVLMVMPYLLFFFVFRKRIFRFYREFRGIYDDSDVKEAQEGVEDTEK